MTDSTLSNSRVTVFGGDGFIGHALCMAFAFEGARVLSVSVSYDADTESAADLRRAGVELRFGDIRDLDTVSAAVAGADIVVNLAGHSGAVRSMEEPFLDLETNGLGALNVLEACRREAYGARVLLASSRLASGSPLSLYGAHKALAEAYHDIYGGYYGMHTRVLRISNVYGPGPLTVYHGMLNGFIARAVARKPVHVFGDGAQLRRPIYMDDVVEAFKSAVLAPETGCIQVEIAGSEGRSVVELAHLVVQLHGSGSVRHVPWPESERTLETGDHNPDLSNAATIGFEPKTSLREGIGKTLEYARKHRLA